MIVIYILNICDTAVWYRRRMWKLKVSDEGDDGWVKSVSNYIGRQYREFDPNLGTPEERAQVERARHGFKINRFQAKLSSDLLMRLQVKLISLSLSLSLSLYIYIYIHLS